MNFFFPSNFEMRVGRVTIFNLNNPFITVRNIFLHRSHHFEKSQNISKKGKLFSRKRTEQCPLINQVRCFKLACHAIAWQQKGITNLIVCQQRCTVVNNRMRRTHARMQSTSGKEHRPEKKENKKKREYIVQGPRWVNARWQFVPRRINREGKQHGVRPRCQLLGHIYIDY